LFFEDGITGIRLACLHARNRVISHTAFAGSFAGPFPFYAANGRLID